MPTIQKFYHRGNNDAAEGDRLTAVFEIKLIVGNEGCTQIEIPIPELGFFYIMQETGFYLPDLAGDQVIALTRDFMLPAAPKTGKRGREQRAPQQSIAEKPGKKGGGPEVARAGGTPIRICLGNVPVTVVVDIKSPSGKGNGEAQAGPIAAQFGLDFNGAFNPFIGGPLRPGSEHWHVSQTVRVAVIPCTGGAAKGSLQINSGAGKPAAYEVSWDVVIASCGAITKADVELGARGRPAGLGAGGLPDPPLREVKAGDPLPYPVKDESGLPGNSPIKVGPGGQPTKQP